MANEGWVKLYRNIQEHWVWEDAQKLKWWLDIILLANHKEAKFLLGNELMKVEKGEFHTSELKLAERWKVSKKTVRNFLTLLESDSMIELKKSKKGTTVKVSNYNAFQSKNEVVGTTKVPTLEPQKNHDGTIEGTTLEPCWNHEGYTNKNDKEEYKNEKNDKECKEEGEPLHNLSLDLCKYYSSLKPNQVCTQHYKQIAELIEIYSYDLVKESMYLMAKKTKVFSIQYMEKVLQNKEKEKTEGSEIVEQPVNYDEGTEGMFIIQA